MQLKTYRTQARLLLKGHWQQLATMVAWWLLITMLLDAGLEGLFGAGTFWYQMGDTFASYFFYFIFLNAVFLATLKLSYHKTKGINAITPLFKKPFYTDLVILNLIQQVLNWGLLLIGLIPFYQLIGWQRVLNFSYNGLTSAASYLMKLSQQPANYFLVLTFLLVLLVITLIQPIILAYYQILVLLKFEFPQASIKMILSLSTVILKGHWLRLLGLVLSFIGWEIVVYLTAGIGFLWFYPYLIMSVTLFYQDIKKDRIQVIQ